MPSKPARHYLLTRNFCGQFWGPYSKGHPCYRMLWEGPSCEGVWWDRKVKIPYR